jgi:Ca-activated chloride channel homolog
MRVLRWSVAVGLLGIPAALAWSTHPGQPVPLPEPDGVTVQAGIAPRAGLVSGVVVGPKGSVMKGVTVELARDHHAVGTTTTDANGRFTFEKVPPGVYEVTARAEGLAPAVVLVAVNDLPGMPLRLALGIQPDMDAAWRTSGAAAKVAGASAPPPAALTRSAESAETSSASAMSALQGHEVLMSRVPIPPEFNTAAYDRIDDNRFRRVSEEPVSTFSTDVDTASYSNVRRFLNQGTLPPPDAVRVEELVNYFRFSYEQPRGEAPLAVTTEVTACPWNPRHTLALVGLQARRDDATHTPARNLVFLLDVSGSMASADRLPLVKAAMRMLVDTLTARDRVAIVVYAGASGLALPSTPGDHGAAINRAIDELQPGGSTNGAAGIQLAYDTAAASFAREGVNRVILATDGDFNVGVTNQGELVRLIEQQRERGVFLSVLGVGDDNLKDSTMEKLADRGNGNYAYLDSLDEARRVLIAEAGSTLVTVAKDVKIQVEFNPRTVAAYRLVGYENRLLNREEFNDDRKDAGDVGAGRTVTALYELIPPGEPIDGPPVDPLKYQEPRANVPNSGSRELMTVKLRYKQPDAGASQVMSVPVADHARELTANLGFAAAVAEYGMLLRGSEFKGGATWPSAQALARRHRGEDADGYRAEFVRLVDLAAALQAQQDSRQTRR